MTLHEFIRTCYKPDKPYDQMTDREKVADFLLWELNHMEEFYGKDSEETRTFSQTEITEYLYNEIKNYCKTYVTHRLGKSQQTRKGEANACI